MPATDQLDHDKIRANLKTRRIGKQILLFTSTSSTNDVAADYAQKKSNDGLAIFAEEQTAGRGRAANKWLAPRSQTILCSVLLTDSPLDPELLSLTAAVAVAQAVSPSAKIKWPNDIFLNAKKVAGILLESKPQTYGPARIIGIGINCHQQPASFPPELQQTATSIDIETKTTSDRISIAKRLLTTLDTALQTAQTNPDEIVNQWRSRSIQLGRRLTLIFNGKKFTGTCIGIDPQKGLTLKLDSTAIKFFNAPQTSILNQP